MPDRRLRIVVLGYIVRGPLAGYTWHHLQYVLGLLQLGHDVSFVEDSDDYESCYDPSRHTMTRDPGYGTTYARRVFDHFGVGDRWAYFDQHTASWSGATGATAREWCRSADVILDLSGVNALQEWVLHRATLVLVDTDPVFLQIRHLTDQRARERAEAHHRFFSFGEAIADGSSSVPDDGFRWQPTRQPIVLDQWSVTPPPDKATFTTVMQWDSYPAASWSGTSYGMKSDSFRVVENLPSTAEVELEIALGGATAPRDMLRSVGWTLRDPIEITADPWRYQRFIRDSTGELSVAKHGYVISGSGWFSERSACYLASGRPVVTQDTGFGARLPTGNGLFAFSTEAEALAAIDVVCGDLGRQCAAARSIAEDHFDSRVVLSALLDRV